MTKDRSPELKEMLIRLGQLAFMKGTWYVFYNRNVYVLYENDTLPTQSWYQEWIKDQLDSFYDTELT